MPTAGTLAARDDADLEFVDADAAGRRVLLAWNVEGRSEVELLDTVTGRAPRPAGLPGEVVAERGAVARRALRGAVGRGPDCARGGCGASTVGTAEWTPADAGRAWRPRDGLVSPTLVRSRPTTG